MHKILIFLLAVLVAFGANVAYAQSYYPSYTGTSYSGTCVNLTGDLSYGSRGSEVSQLQTFLVSHDFPGSGSWMITGNFRSATLAAVRNFQQSQGLPITGVADAATRSATSRVSCAGYPYTTPFNYNYNYTNNTNCYYTYPYTCNNYLNYNNVALSSFSVTTGLPGTSVTIYGSNFDYFNNTVYFGQTPLMNIPSYNGTSLTFTVPSYVTAGTVGVYVVNSRGTSNTLNFAVISTYSAYNCPGLSGYQYTYGSYGTYGYNYCPPNSGVIALTYLNPNSSAVGSTVTIVGSGFSQTGNTVRFGGGVITGLASSDGRTLSFTVPSQLVGGSSDFVRQDTYNVSVSNFGGQTSNALPFTVTAGSGSYGTITLSSVSPMLGRVGSQVILTGSGFTPLENTVHFGIGGTQHVPSYNGTTIYYTIPSFVSPCDMLTQGALCAQNVQQVLPGSIQMYVTNSVGMSNAILFQVTN